MASQILNSEPNNRHPPSFPNRPPRFPCFTVFLLCPLPSNIRATLTRHTKTLLRYSKVAIKIGGKVRLLLALHGWLVRSLLPMIGIGTSPRHETGLGCNMDSNDLFFDCEYYFHIPSNLQYAVCPCFQQWLFPHNNLPPGWPPEASGDTITGTGVPLAQSNLSASPIHRDKQCKISAAQGYLEAAHLRPRSELE